MNPPRVDLSNDDSFAQGFPHDYFDWLRQNAPVFWHEPTAVSPNGDGFWVVSRHQEVMQVLRNPKTFSSHTGGDRRGGGTSLKDEKAAGKILNYTDDPHHRVLRGLVNKGFTAQAVGKLESDLRRRANALIDEFPEGDQFEFVTQFSREVPLQAICIVLGVPQEDRLQLCTWVDQGLEATSQNIMGREFITNIRNYAHGIIAEKRRNPKDDILSAIVHARLPEEGNRALDDEELCNFFTLLFPAGAETTRSAIGGGLRLLIENPDQLQKLRLDLALMKSAVEEIVRRTTPSIYKRRTLTQDSELAGVKLKTGDKLTVWEMSANHDEAVFEDPFKFDIARSPNRHLGFGFGAHICLGAGLARLEIKLCLEELLRRIEDFRLNGPAEWIPNNRLLGLKRMPMSVKFKH